MTPDHPHRQPLVGPITKAATAISVFGLVILGILLWAHPAAAQSLNLDLQNFDADGTARLVQLIVLFTVLSIAPAILIMMTSFTRIVVVLSFLRVALGTQQTPPNQVLVSLAMFLTLFIMMPVFQQAYDTAFVPMIEGNIEEAEAFSRAVIPFRNFMLSHVREQDVALFADFANLPEDQVGEDIPIHVLIPAFIISELRRAFEIGFLIFVPFLVIDMVVSSVLMAMGMMMLPPVIIALPFKIIFFVLVDGWYMVVGSLVRSFGAGG